MSTWRDARQFLILALSIDAGIAFALWALH